MSDIGSFVIALGITFVLCLLITLALRSALARILIELCGTEARAHFWTRLSTILLIALPLVRGLGYNPSYSGSAPLFFEIAQQVRGNLAAHLFALVMLAFGIAFFALVAPRQPSPKVAEGSAASA